jgi:hypothetical protein
MRTNRRTALVALICAPVLAGCGAGDDTAGPERGVDVGEIQEEQPYFQGDYLGQQVTVSATVTRVLSPTGVELAGGDYGDDSLLVVTAEPTRVRAGDEVRATGTVGQYHRVLDDDPMQYGLYEDYLTEAYLYDARLEPVPARP